jgi:hypothetical protein
MGSPRASWLPVGGEDDGARAELRGADLEGDAGAGARLLHDDRDGAAGEGG